MGKSTRIGRTQTFGPIIVLNENQTFASASEKSLLLWRSSAESHGHESYVCKITSARHNFRQGDTGWTFLAVALGLWYASPTPVEPNSLQAISPPASRPGGRPS
ncbi:MAG: hypothetical protein MI923_27720 [Phycisphaerales bacterium]|nr:hypothetical protein [Phycisphaerales bacterium]